MDGRRRSLARTQGASAAPAFVLNWAEELRCALRYFLSLSSYPFGNAWSNGLATAQVVFPVPMRSTPSISGASYSVNTGNAGVVSLILGSSLAAQFWNSSSNWTVNANLSIAGLFDADL